MYSMVKIAKAAEPKGNIPWLSLLANFFRLFVMTELLRWSWESMCWRRDKLWLWTRALTMGFYFSILSSLAMLETKRHMCRSLRWSSPISWSHTQKLTKTLSSRWTFLTPRTAPKHRADYDCSIVVTSEERKKLKIIFSLQSTRGALLNMQWHSRNSKVSTQNNWMKSFTIMAGQKPCWWSQKKKWRRPRWWWWGARESTIICIVQSETISSS